MSPKLNFSAVITETATVGQFQFRWDMTRHTPNDKTSFAVLSNPIRLGENVKQFLRTSVTRPLVVNVPDTLSARVEQYSTIPDKVQRALAVSDYSGAVDPSNQGSMNFTFIVESTCSENTCLFLVSLAMSDQARNPVSQTACTFQILPIENCVSTRDRNFMTVPIVDPLIAAWQFCQPLRVTDVSQPFKVRVMCNRLNFLPKLDDWCWPDKGEAHPLPRTEVVLAVEVSSTTGQYVFETETRREDQGFVFLD